MNKAYQPSLAITPNGEAWLAWTGNEVSGTIPSEVYVRMWDGASWVELDGSGRGGGISNTPSADSHSPAVAVDGGGQVFVVWVEEESGNAEIAVRAWNGSGWSDLAGPGGISNTPGPSREPSLIADELDRPMVAWAETSTDATNIYLRRYHQGVWQQLSSSAVGGGISRSGAPSFSPSLATKGDRACVAWTELVTSTSQIHIRCLTLDLEP
jgi:hypothetical protein